MEQYFAQNAWWFIPMMLWTIPWKGVAMWKAARNDSKPWFIALMLINTVGILEIIYIFVFAKKKATNDKN